MKAAERGSWEAFCWGLFLGPFGVLVVAILFNQFTNAERPLWSALWGTAICVVVLSVLWALATTPVR